LVTGDDLLGEFGLTVLHDLSDEGFDPGRHEIVEAVLRLLLIEALLGAFRQGRMIASAFPPMATSSGSFGPRGSRARRHLNPLLTSPADGLLSVHMAGSAGNTVRRVRTQHTSIDRPGRLARRHPHHPARGRGPMPADTPDNAGGSRPHWVVGTSGSTCRRGAPRVRPASAKATVRLAEALRGRYPFDARHNWRHTASVRAASASGENVLNQADFRLPWCPQPRGDRSPRPGLPPEATPMHEAAMSARAMQQALTSSAFDTRP
jgi:hypothetical protein